MENNIDKEKIFLDNIGNRMKLAKENGCKLLDCKTIDNNIKLRLENIKLKSELEKYKNVTYFEKLEDGKLYEIDKERADDLYEHGNGNFLYIQMWKRKEG